VKEYTAENVRNVAFLGHSGSGKSTFAESLLFRHKHIERMGRTEDGNLVSDYDAEEVKRRMSINATLLPVETKNIKVNVLDCPGSRDFISETFSCLRVADGVVIFVDAGSGVQVGAELALEWAEERNLPVAIFVNKLDKENTDFAKTIEELNNVLGKKCVPLSWPIGKDKSLVGVVEILDPNNTEDKDGKKIEVPADLLAHVASLRDQVVESAAEGDDTLMEKFFSEGALTDEEIARGLEESFAERRFIPVFAGSALLNIGIRPFMDFMEASFPNPLQMPGLEGVNGTGPKVFPVKPNEPFSAFVFKTLSDDFTGRLTFFKVISGSLLPAAPMKNVTRDKEEKVAHVLTLRGKKQEEVAKINAGDIGVVAKLTLTGTNDTLCDPKLNVKFNPTLFPQRTSVMAIHAKSSQDEDKIGIGLHALIEQDPTLHVERDAECHQTLLSGMGEQHLEVAVGRLKAKTKVDLAMDVPKIRYRETITKKAEGMYRHKKQSGGRGQFAEVHMRLAPHKDADYEFKWSVFGGAIPTNYQSAVDKGCHMAMEKGILAGYRVVGVHADCFDGKYHDVDSSDMAFQIASSQAFKQIALQSGPIILEPICTVTTIVPESYMGDVMGDVSQRRGHIAGTESVNSKSVVKAMIPEAEMVSYAQNLRSMTGGRGTFERAFSHYEPVPHEIQAKIVETAKKEHVAEEE
jgi:elongation factor G